MSGQTLSRLAAVTGILAGLAPSAAASTPAPPTWSSASPGSCGSRSTSPPAPTSWSVSASSWSIGGVIAFWRPALGIGIVCAAALIGLIGVYDRGRPIGGGDPLRSRWIPYVYYWGAPWVLAWIAGIFAGLFLQKTVEQHDSPAEIDKPRAATARS